GVGKVLDPRGFADAVRRLDRTGIVPATTCYRGVERLLPATALRVAPGESRRWQYWQAGPGRVTTFGRAEEVYEAIRERLRRAVRQRVRGRFPVACLLSGGLDSSSIAGLAAESLAGERELIAVSSVLPEHSPAADGPDERQEI